MIHATLSAIAKQLNIAMPEQDNTFQGISTDTRTLTAGNLYIAIRGEKFDGHDFIAEAMKHGASAALVDHRVDLPIPQLVVADTILALGQLTAHWRDQFVLPVVGVTGSNGKTTLKNMLASIFKAACQPEQVLATEGNLNNNIGLPINLARLNAKHRYAVLEMGMNHFGEIEYLTRLAKPTVAIINNAAAAHLAGVKDVAGVAKAKGEIFLGLDQHGIAILNRDDAHFDYWRTLIADKKYFTFGLKNKADVSAEILDGQKIRLITPQGNVALTLPLLGEHNIMNALAATAAAMAVGIELSTIAQGLEHVQPAPGRMRCYTLPQGITIIDDTYNANPFSLQAAVNTLAAYPDKKILILGDMKELGAEEKQLHFNCGEKIRAAGINYLFTFGNLSAAAAEAFGENAYHFTEREKLLAALQPHLTAGTTILIKGSRSMQMEKFVAGIIPKNQLEHTH